MTSDKSARGPNSVSHIPALEAPDQDHRAAAHASILSTDPQWTSRNIGVSTMPDPVMGADAPQKAPLLPPTRGITPEISNVAVLPVVDDPVSVPRSVLLVLKMQWKPKASTVPSVPDDVTVPFPWISMEPTWRVVIVIELVQFVTVKPVRLPETVSEGPPVLEVLPSIVPLHSMVPKTASKMTWPSDPP